MKSAWNSGRKLILKLSPYIIRFHIPRYSADSDAWSNNFNTIFWSDVHHLDASGNWLPVVLNRWYDNRKKKAMSWLFATDMPRVYPHVPLCVPSMESAGVFGHKGLTITSITFNSLFPCDATWCQITHWGRDKMDAISQTLFLSAFSSMKMFEFWMKSH